jgi:hypothetical protein
MYLDKADFKQAMTRITKMLCVIILGKGEKLAEGKVRRLIAPKPAEMLSEYDVKEVLDGAIAAAMEEGLVFSDGENLLITPDGLSKLPSIIKEIQAIQGELRK